MALAWESFESLEGSPERNLELLWRGIVQRHWSRYGVLRSRRNQPGVEFHLELHTDCSLGIAGRWFGWQCRWYELKTDNGFRASQKTSIEDAIRKTRQYVSGISDFVLCLRELPSSSDIEWFNAFAEEDFNVHLWADEQLDAWLQGDAENLRKAFFGELILSSESLRTGRERSLEPVRDRWMPDLNVSTDTEELLNAALLRPGTLGGLPKVGELLASRAQHVRELQGEVPEGELTQDLESVTAEVEALSEKVLEIATAVDELRPQDAVSLLNQDLRPHISFKDARAASRRLRRLNRPVSLAISVAVAEVRGALRQVRSLRTMIESPFLAVVGEAGSGKSHLSAQITQSDQRHPAGVFIQGGELGKERTFDELVRAVPGLELSTIDELLAAVDAAGARLGVRIPIVIDGLNEAERPKRWRSQLQQVLPVLGEYPNALLVVTLRDTHKEELIPDGVEVLDLVWEGSEVEEAVEIYFRAFQIDAGSMSLPYYLFSDPLFLRFYCEAVNPAKREPVGVEKLPNDLVEVFELYRSQVLSRISDELDLRPGLPGERLTVIAGQLWERNQRTIPFAEMQEIIDEPDTEWNRSLVKAFEDSAVLNRTGDTGWDDPQTGLLFDRFGGFLIADAILRPLSPQQAEVLFASEEFWRKLRGEDRHPLADDILRALTGLVPRRFWSRHLWSFAPETQRTPALLGTLNLASELLDDETLEALADLIRSGGAPRSRYRHPFDRLWEVRDGVKHRLNADYLELVLKPMEVAQRDLSWTEWTRARSAPLMKELGYAIKDWEQSDHRDDRDDLEAQAISWLLTSTVVELRDMAAKALQRFGRVDPRRLFELAISSLDTNDPYIWNAMLPACFAVATEHQMPVPGGPYERSLKDVLELLTDRLVGKAASHPTSNQLVRQTVADLLLFARALHSSAAPANVDMEAPDFAPGPQTDRLPRGSEAGDEADLAVGMDFANYSVGSLYPDRSPYQEHAGHSAGLDEIRGRIWDLGWRDDRFGRIDDRIQEDRWRRLSYQREQTVERYGKKYSWIAFYELAGRLADRGELREPWLPGGRPVDMPVDPSFPSRPSSLRLNLPQWANPGLADEKVWFREGSIELPSELLEAETVNGHEGLWVLVEAYLTHEDEPTRRRVFGYFEGMLVDSDDIAAIENGFDTEEWPNRVSPTTPESHGMLLGDFPWRVGLREMAAEGREGPYFDRAAARWNPDPELQDPGIPVELTSHIFSGDARGSDEASGSYLPSFTFAQRFGLRKAPGSLDLVGLDGRVASLSLTPPDGFEGHLLYLRKDLLIEYAEGRSLLQLCWGERQIKLALDEDHPSWRIGDHAYDGVWRATFTRPL